MIDSRRGYNDSRGEGTMKVQCAWRGCTGGTIQLKTYSVSTILVCQRSTINRSHIVNSQEIGGQIFRISSNSLKIKLLQKRCFIYWCSMLSVLEYQLVGWPFIRDPAQICHKLRGRIDFLSGLVTDGGNIVQLCLDLLLQKSGLFSL